MPKRTLLANLHCTSNFSSGSLSIPEIVDLYGSQGFQVLGIADRLVIGANPVALLFSQLGGSLNEATFAFYQKILRSEAKRAWEEYSMLLIPGISWVPLTACFSFRKSQVILGPLEGLNYQEVLLVSDQANLQSTAMLVGPLKSFHQLTKSPGLRFAWPYFLKLFSCKNFIPNHFHFSDFQKMTQALMPRKSLTGWKSLIECDLNFQGSFEDHFEKSCEQVFEALKSHRVKMIFFNEPKKSSWYLGQDTH